MRLKPRFTSFAARFAEFRRLSALLGRDDGAQRAALRISDTEFQEVMSSIECGEPLLPRSSSLPSEVAFQNYLMLLMLASSSALLDIGRPDVARTEPPKLRSSSHVRQQHAERNYEQSAFVSQAHQAYRAALHQHEGASS